MNLGGAGMTYQRLSANRPVAIDLERLWNAWAKSGLAKQELATVLGVHRKTITNWFASRRVETTKFVTTKQVRAISKSCKCTIGYLIGINDELKIASAGEALRYLRRKKGLTQYQLADKIFSNQYYIHKWETGKEPIPEEMIKRLA